MSVLAFLDRPTRPALTAQDSTRLDRWRQLYWLQTQGFTRDQARRIVFLRLWFSRPAQRAEGTA